MPKQYIFQAGSFRDLSRAELFSVFEIYNINKDTIHFFSDDIFIIKSQNISEEILLKVFNRLGGYIRLLEIIENIDNFLEEYTNKDTKIVFGLSILNSDEKPWEDGKYLKNLGNEIKRGLKEYGISSRFVSPRNRDIELNTAQMINNHILSKGFELCIVKNRKEEIYCKTIAIQDMEGYIKRDMKRPYSDIDMGVLPPKLARMMINYASLKEGTIWDPFCGSGTIPMESAVLGYNFLASDIDSNAIYYTEENIKWLNKEGDIGNIVYEAFRLDVSKPEKDIIKRLKNTSIDAIVCEPFMGPPQKRVLSLEKANILLNSVKELYLSLFKLIDEDLGLRGIKMVLIIPSYMTDSGWKTFGISDVITNRWEILNSKYSPHRDLKWSRKNSIITRNIFILRRT